MIIVTSTRASALAAALGLLGATPALATPIFYQAQTSGTLIHADGSSSSIGQANTDTSAPAQYGTTGTTYQVGANANAQDGGTVASNIQLAPQPRVTGVDYAQKLQGQSVVTYRITIAGPTNTALPVEIKANGAISWSQNGAADAYFKFADYDHPSLTTTVVKEINQNDVGRSREKDVDYFSVDTTFFLNTNDTYSIVESTSATADVRQFANLVDYSNDNALVDPSFTVLGPDASLYTIQGVPVGDTASGPAPVPEPASWMLMAAGLAVAAAGARRSRGTRRTPRMA